MISKRYIIAAWIFSAIGAIINGTILAIRVGVRGVNDLLWYYAAFLCLMLVLYSYEDYKRK